MTTNDELRDLAVSHQLYLLRYQAQLVRRITEVLQMAEEDIRRQLVDLDTETGTARLEAQLVGIRLIIDSSWAKAAQELASDLTALAEYEALHQNAVLIESVPVLIDTALPPVETIIAAVESRPFEGKILKEWVDKLTEDSFIRIRDAVRMGVIEGESYDQITKRVMGTKALKYSDGVLALNFRQAQALVATAVSHTVNEARQTYYAENTRYIKGVQWVSTLDMRTTPVCQSRDGKVYPIDSGPRPPAHFRCRSTTAPVVKSWEELGLEPEDLPPATRTSMDGRISQAETYETWLRKKPAAFQDDVLGPTRGKLFREGMSLDRFVDQTGKEYTLKQLKSKDSTLFRKAGID